MKGEKNMNVFSLCCAIFSGIIGFCGQQSSSLVLSVKLFNTSLIEKQAMIFPQGIESYFAFLLYNLFLTNGVLPLQATIKLWAGRIANWNKDFHRKSETHIQTKTRKWIFC